MFKIINLYSSILNYLMSRKLAIPYVSVEYQMLQSLDFKKQNIDRNNTHNIK